MRARQGRRGLGTGEEEQIQFKQNQVLRGREVYLLFESGRRGGAIVFEGWRSKKVRNKWCMLCSTLALLLTFVFRLPHVIEKKKKCSHKLYLAREMSG